MKEKGGRGQKKKRQTGSQLVVRGLAKTASCVAQGKVLEVKRRRLGKGKKQPGIEKWSGRE